MSATEDVPRSPRSQIGVVRAAGKRLGDELASLTPEEWDLPGACGVWTVGEVVAHLAQWAGAYADLIGQALAGDVQVMDTSPVLPYAIRAARYAEEAKAYRRELGAGLLGAYVRSQRELVDTLPIRLRGSFARRDPLPEPLRYLFVLTPPLLRLVTLVIYGDRFEIDPEGDESADTVLTLHPQTYILAFTGRMTWHEALAAGTVGVTGRQDLAAELDAWFGPG